jgi:aspartyl protease family protein
MLVREPSVGAAVAWVMNAMVKGMPGKLFLTFALLIVAAAPVQAVDITVVGLFPGKAVVRIDGERLVMSEGETSHHGVTLLQADSETARFEVGGEVKEYRLGMHIGTNYSALGPGKKHRIYRASNNMFETGGFINGVSVHFMVDTGASSVAMNSGHARQIGLRYKKGRQIGVSTANGVTSGYVVNLDRVRVGDIELTNVEAIVLEGNSPPEILLGLSFLDRLHWTKNDTVIELERKY